MSSSSFTLDADHRRLKDQTRAVGRDVLRPIAARGRRGRVNRALVKALADAGLLGRLFPAPSGGRPAATALELCLLREALALESTEAETALALQGLGAYPILWAGSSEVAERWIPPVAAGDAVAAFALTEPGAGSDAASLELCAERAAGGWRLTGTKSFISNAPAADIYTVFARTSPAAGARGISAFAVPGDAPGLAGESLHLLTRHPVGTLELDGVAVSGDHLLGDVDEGFGIAMRVLDLFRPSVGAFAVGMAEAALEASLSHAAARRAFGRPLRDFQAVSHRLAEMATRIEAARLLVYAAAAALDAGERVTGAAAMAKLYATETAQYVVDAAVQIHGAIALQEGHLLEHLYREVRAPRIYEGASDIQREVIARRLFEGRIPEDC